MKENLKLFVRMMAFYFPLMLIVAIFINASDVYLNLGELPHIKTQVIKLAYDWGGVFGFMLLSSICLVALLIFKSSKKKI